MLARSGVVLSLLLLITTLHANIITNENARAGTDRWQLRSSASADIAAYASATSVAPGETIRFFVSTPDPKFQLEVFRMGWYGGLGGRRMTDAVERAGGAQPMPSPDANGMIRCQWHESDALTIPDDWVSGVYLAKITGKPSEKQNYVIFVVRDERAADLYFQTSVTTYQAYNNWGGKSLYAFNSTGAPATKVSFDRPYSLAAGPADFLLHWEYPMVRFLEREGYDVTYGTNIDTHARPEMLRRVKAFLSVGHDEYWSWEMRANVEAARDAGVDLAFFSANVCFWQIRLEDELRTIVAHKETALATDPYANDGDPSNDSRITTQWRLVPVLRPEEAFIGVMSVESQIDADIVIDNPSHWVFAKTNLARGDHLPGLLGYEVDEIVGMQSPPNLVRLAHSPYVNEHGETGFSDMTIYTAPSGAIVFAAGTMQWSWGLDGYGPPSRGNRVSAAAQQIARNVLDRMIGKTMPYTKRRAVR
jgi:hypothetical protein